MTNQKEQLEALVRRTCASVHERLQQHGGWCAVKSLKQDCVTEEMAMECYDLADHGKHWLCKDEDEESFGRRVLVKLAFEQLKPYCDFRLVPAGGEYRLRDAVAAGDVVGPLTPPKASTST
jgi:hypothetical protein